MTEETSYTRSGQSWASMILGLIVLVFVFGVLFRGNAWGNGFGGWGGNGCGYGYGYEGGCLRTSNCEVERRGLITAAETNYRIIDQAQATREVVQATANATQTKIDFYAYQDLRDKLAEQQRQNMMLQNQIYSDAKFNALAASIADIKCNMLRRPDVTGIGAVCPNAGILNGLGINSFSNGCGCNSCGTGFTA